MAVLEIIIIARSKDVGGNGGSKVATEFLVVSTVDKHMLVPLRLVSYLKRSREEALN